MSSRVSPRILKTVKFLIMRHTADKLLSDKVNVFPKLKPKHKVK